LPAPHERLWTAAPTASGIRFGAKLCVSRPAPCQGSQHYPGESGLSDLKDLVPGELHLQEWAVERIMAFSNDPNIAWR
jgi:hypothetical protein